MRDALKAEIAAVLKADLILSRARTRESLQAAALTSLASLVPDRAARVTVYAEPGASNQFRISVRL